MENKPGERKVATPQALQHTGDLNYCGQATHGPYVFSCLTFSMTLGCGQGHFHFHLEKLMLRKTKQGAQSHAAKQVAELGLEIRSLRFPESCWNHCTTLFGDRRTKTQRRSPRPEGDSSLVYDLLQS